MTGPKTALITGANGGIGSALSRKLHSAGTRLVLVGRNEEALKNLSSELGAKSLFCDLTHPDEVASCITAAIEELGEIEAVAHCIGSILLKPAHLTSISDWQSVIDTNLNSAFYLLHNLGRPMSKSGGSIAFVTSAAAEKGLSNHEAIASAKAGLAGLTRSAAATYARNQLRLNCVHQARPG